MELPEDIKLPFFAYGLFKPGELAYRRIEALVAEPPIRSFVRGSLWIRDGLPLLDPRPGDEVSGFVLQFYSDKSYEAYQIIAEVEPDKQYRWNQISPNGFPGLVNVLVGRRPEKGSIHHEESEWFGRYDPVFVNALPLVREVEQAYGRQPFRSAPPDAFEWERLFRLQMAYLLLWSSIERYCSLCFGANLDPMAKVSRLGEGSIFGTYLRQVVSRTHRVYDSRDPSDHTTLDPQKPIPSAKYYYMVRSNLRRHLTKNGIVMVE
ncbi:MAG TPA: hypothetical protein VLA19_15950 [Herpetosiphonaceae bacterium]|nr:hypothetical protein [Herpetosiphonaceae bacterium]